MKRFWRDLKLGKDIEKKISMLYEKEGYTQLQRSDDSRFDLVLQKDTQIKSFEIKTDLYCSKEKDSGNIFVEYEYKGRPSGINVSEADWWVFYFLNLEELWFIQTDKLKSLIDEYTFLTTYQSGDDGSNTRGYLIPRNEPNIKNNFIMKKIKL